MARPIVQRRSARHIIVSSKKQQGMKYGFKYAIVAGQTFEVDTKNELFSYIREITRKGFQFVVRSYYKGGKRDRAGYIIEILSHKDN